MNHKATLRNQCSYNSSPLKVVEVLKQVLKKIISRAELCRGAHVSYCPLVCLISRVKSRSCFGKEGLEVAGAGRDGGGVKGLAEWREVEAGDDGEGSGTGGQVETRRWGEAVDVGKTRIGRRWERNEDIAARPVCAAPVVVGRQGVRGKGRDWEGGGGVLEALHYCPDSEESFRTAKITWRLLDSSSSPTPELHFISSNTQDKRAARRDAAALTSGTGLEHGFRERHRGQECTPLPVPSAGYASSGVCGQLEGAYKHQIIPISASGVRENKNVACRVTPLSSRTWRKVCSEHEMCHPECRSQGQARGRLARLQHPASACRVPFLPRGRGGWYKAEELMDMDVVQSILQKGPRYSATCWSAAETNATRGAMSLPSGYELLDSSFNQIRNVKFEANYVSKRAAPRGREHAYLCGSEQEGAWGEECEAPFLCSTLRSDSDSEDTNLAASDESPPHVGVHARDLASAVQGHPLGLKEWTGLEAERQVWACTSLPARRHCFDLTKYKTEMCRSFQYNSHCGYGEACLYAHGMLDLRSCPRHPMYRTKQCFSFHHKVREAEQRGVGGHDTTRHGTARYGMARYGTAEERDWGEEGERQALQGAAGRQAGRLGGLGAGPAARQGGGMEGRMERGREGVATRCTLISFIWPVSPPKRIFGIRQ
ncbi:Zinc finger protein 36, C3H1 type-like 2-B [Portunus trituberculatus]|uniref:Zinc finger protein 36, C3H1 type-like 2-B n=1 Tax=Portunus trituberculatus TaxID=210409 RepID=A0A5B7DMQ0_PORTR|nr:Zinc finger protein 36, C3H1 type-like 2-B [Portunus trituberculatus]